MLRVPLNSVDETNAEFCIYKRTFFRGRVPVKLLNTPTAFVDNTQGTSWESESDVLFLVCKNTVDIVKFEYSSHELVTVDTLLFPFQARNAASLVVPHWKDAFMLLISCEKNMLLVIEYSCVTQRLVPYRLLKLELSDKDLLGSHLCVDPFR